MLLVFIVRLGSCLVYSKFLFFFGVYFFSLSLTVVFVQVPRVVAGVSGTTPPKQMQTMVVSQSPGGSYVSQQQQASMSMSISGPFPTPTPASEVVTVVTPSIPQPIASVAVASMAAGNNVSQAPTAGHVSVSKSVSPQVITD